MRSGVCRSSDNVRQPLTRQSEAVKWAAQFYAVAGQLTRLCFLHLQSNMCSQSAPPGLRWNCISLVRAAREASLVFGICHRCEAACYIPRLRHFASIHLPDRRPAIWIHPSLNRPHIYSTPTAPPPSQIPPCCFLLASRLLVGCALILTSRYLVRHRFWKYLDTALNCESITTRSC